ncbi:MAG TPA: phytase, partial [Roseiflexaceae bacterium]|nr:phytase [Roseiflexaceae bacterium]
MKRYLRPMFALLYLGAVGVWLGGPAVSHADRASQFTQALASVSATLETTPVPHTGDAADDPAIWIHPSNPAQSTIIGTDKQGGVAVYDLAGNQIQFRADGEINNVDLRYNFPLGGQPVALVAASNDTNNSIAIYRVDTATRRLENVAARTIIAGLSPYGSCMYRSSISGTYYVFVDAKDGRVEQWELFAVAGGLVDAKRVRSFDVGT